jgi:DNA-binding transcriptional MerR regulator
LSIGELAERTGLSVHTLRFYEREGIFATPVRRALNGHRVYSEEDLEWLDTCSNVRASGMSLAAIRRYAELVRQGSGNEEERLTLLRQHRERVTTQISELSQCLDLHGLWPEAGSGAKTPSVGAGVRHQQLDVRLAHVDCEGCRLAGDPRANRRGIRVRAGRGRSRNSRGRVRVVLVQGLVLEQRTRKRVELAPVLLQQRNDFLM